MQLKLWRPRRRRIVPTSVSGRSLEINGLRFTGFVANQCGSTIGYSAEYVIKIEDMRWPTKRHDISQEIDIIKKLNKLDCASTPKIIHQGTINDKDYYNGKKYFIAERVHHLSGVTHADVLLAFLELKGCGILHGDLMQRNCLFNGEHSVLVDYDQSIDDPVVSQMTMRELFEYLKTDYDDESAESLPLETQLSRYKYKKYFVDGKLDLKYTTLFRKAISTNTTDGIYHDLHERFVMVNGERGLSGRKEVLDRIDVSGETVLDIGCNTGLLTRYFVRRGADRVDGYERSRETAIAGQVINRCEGIVNSSIMHRDLSEESISSDYDTIVLFSVLHHIDNMQHAVLEIKKHCSRIIIECRTQEDGSQYSDRWVSTNSWSFSDLPKLIAYLEKMFGFRFSTNYGQVDRDRYILEFVK